MFTKGNALIFYQFLSTTRRDISLDNEYEDTFAVNHLLSPPPPHPGGRGYLFQMHLRGEGLNRGGALIWEGGGVFYLAKMMVSVFHKEPKYNVEKLKYKKLDVMQPRIENKSNLPAGE